MALEEELLQWVGTLTRSEKRFISLIGKARAGSGSQLLELFDWLNKAETGDTVPPDASFATNLPTLAVRLRELILDCLRLLQKESDVNAVLRTGLDEVAILQSKKQWSAAARLLRKAKKTAYEASRYTYILQYIEAEQQQAQQLPPDEIGAVLTELRKEEELVIARHRALRELRYRHDSVHALAKQFPFSRNPEIAVQVEALADAEVVIAHINSAFYLENALAVNTLGMRDLFLRNPEPAIERYSKLLNTWKSKTDWQEDQSDLLLTICKYYQNVCFYSTVNPGKVHSDLLSLKGFDGLPSEKLRAFRETMFHHRFIHQLNTGKLSNVIEMVPEIENWLEEEEAHLTESQILPFLCNIMVAEFLSEDFSKANYYLNKILTLPNRNVRIDIREFALILQPVVQYELGNTGLNEYLTRSRKRHFSKNEAHHAFELSVIRNIELMMRANDKKERKQVIEQFISELGDVQKLNTQAVPLLGLNEISMWAESRLNHVPLPDVFMDVVKKMHEQAQSDALD